MLSSAEDRFARAARVARLATADAQGQPHAVPVTFVLLDGVFYFAVDEKPKRTTRLKRLRNIAENPRVSLIIDRYDEDWSRLAWLLAQGRADILEDGPERDRAIAALRQKYPQYRDMRLAGPAVRIQPERITSWGDIG